MYSSATSLTQPVHARERELRGESAEFGTETCLAETLRDCERKRKRKRQRGREEKVCHVFTMVSVFLVCFFSYFSATPPIYSQYQFDKTHCYLNGIRRRKGNGQRSGGGGLPKLFTCHTKIPLALAGLASVGLAPQPARATGMTSRI